MAKKIIVVILTVLLFISAACLGVTTVFRVKGVAVEASMVSKAAEEEAMEIKLLLEEAYMREGTLFLDDTAAKEIVKKYPYFRITAFEKAYPDRIVIKIAEDAEVYAVQGAENGYYLLNAQGEILGVREDYANRFDEQPNLLIKGVEVHSQDGKSLSGDECYSAMLALLKKMDGLLDGVRRNATEAEVIRRSPETIVRVQMREGVELCIVNPQEQTEKKAEMAINKYLSLTDAQRLGGYVIVSSGVNDVVVDYTAEKIY